MVTSWPVRGGDKTEPLISGKVEEEGGRFTTVQYATLLSTVMSHTSCFEGSQNWPDEHLSSVVRPHTGLRVTVRAPVRS